MKDIRARAAAIFAGLTFRLILLGVIALLAFNTYADFAVKGPLGIGFHFEGWKPRALRVEAERKAIESAQAVALERAEAARARTEQKYLRLAGRIDNEAHNAREGALADAERFIAANRVRCQTAGGGSGGTATPAADRRAGGGNGPSGAPELDDSVAVTAEDVRICTRNTVRLEAARSWALELEQQDGQ